MPAEVDPDLVDRVERHYRRCEQVLRNVDVDGFLDWLGPDGSFQASDGATVRVADTRPFWEWRFANVVDVSRCDMTIEDVAWTDVGTLAVDFHEVSHMVVRDFGGQPVDRTADLHNRNWWRVDADRLTSAGGAELVARRTLGGAELTDDELDPWGFAAWRRHRGTASD